MKNINPKAIAIVILILLGFGILLASMNTENNNAKEDKLEKELNFILEDAKAKYKDADLVEIINVMPLVYGKGCEKCVGGVEGYLITIKLVYYEEYNGVICPKRYHIRYIYPDRGFANMPPEEIVGDCKLCEKGECKISMKEEAIIASYNRDKEVREFIKNNKAMPSVYGEDGDSEWKVVWIGNGKKMEVVVDKEGKILRKELIEV